MIWAIDHGAATPLRDQIVTCIRKGITTGQLSVGDPLPTMPLRLARSMNSSSVAPFSTTAARISRGLTLTRISRLMPLGPPSRICRLRRAVRRFRTAAGP